MVAKKTALVDQAPAAAGWKKHTKAAVMGLWAVGLVIFFFALNRGEAYNLNGGVFFALGCLLLGYLWVAGGAWMRGVPTEIGVVRVAASGLIPLGLLQGAWVAAYINFGFQSLVYFSLANALFAWVVLSWQNRSIYEEPESNWVSNPVVLVAVALAVGWVVKGMHDFMNEALKVPEDKNSMNLIFLSRVWAAATDIGGNRFTQKSLLIAPLLFGVVTLLGGWALWTWQRRRTGLLLAFLVLMAVLGKIAIASMSAYGLDIVGMKISSINTNYYNLTGKIDEIGLWTYLKEFNSLQVKQGFHGDTHPPGAVVFYWMLRHIFGSAQAVGYAMMTICALTVLPLYSFIKDAGWGKAGGIAVAVLFLTTPISLILSAAGIDSMILFCMALGLACIARGVLDKPFVWGMAGGAAFFVGSQFGFGLPAAIMFAGLWSLVMLWRRTQSLSAWAIAASLLWAGFALGSVGPHLLMYAVFGGTFSYIQAMNTAQWIHSAANHYRVYEFWSWGNVVLYSGYAGAGLLGLYLVRLFSALWRNDNRDPALLLSMPFILTLIFACLGRAEVQRQFLFGAYFLLVAAAPAMVRMMPDGSRELRMSALGAVATMNIVNAVILEMHVLDYW
jgi:hypothetical protein